MKAAPGLGTIPRKSKVHRRREEDAFSREQTCLAGDQTARLSAPMVNLRLLLGVLVSILSLAAQCIIASELIESQRHSVQSAQDKDKGDSM